MWKQILGKNGTGNKDTNEKVRKNGTLMLNFPKLKPSTPNLNPHPNTQSHSKPCNIENVPFLLTLPFVPLLPACHYYLRVVITCAVITCAIFYRIDTVKTYLAVFWKVPYMQRV